MIQEGFMNKWLLIWGVVTVVLWLGIAVGTAIGDEHDKPEPVNSPPGVHEPI